ncbi:MAG: isoleucine--tRNA ligase [Chloroflexota bacterium]|nr:MAG: isoleucine--tRNA ligase [Chloroflexota bacterium]
MPFQEVKTQVDFSAQEREILKFWRETQAFEKTRALHKGEEKWSFIDGPITANNPMGVHHGWGRSYKDLYNRFWTMRGRELRYQNGFDCQGLWVEVEVEKALGFKSKKDIEQYGLAQFVLKCKERVLRYAGVQTDQSIRLGYWMDWNDSVELNALADKLVTNPQEVVTVQGPEGPVTDTVEQIVGRLGLPELGGSYFTFSNENNYMIWTFLKKCWENDWLYRGADVMPWCPRCATGISQHEIVTDGYAELSHQGVTLKFPLRGRLKSSLLVWTTTPWTLTSNVAAAVGPNLTYVQVKQGDEIFYLSKGTTHMLKGKYEVMREFKGSEMEGWTYDGPFDELPAENEIGGNTELRELVKDVNVSAKDAHRVILWDEVSEEEGTGIVHIAPGCGGDDYKLGRQLHLPLVAPLDDEGVFVDGFDWLSGKQVTRVPYTEFPNGVVQDSVADAILENLRAKNLLYRVEPYLHRYPICWRCKTPLVYRLVDEWFISMEELRGKMMEVTEQINWIPSFGLDRELDWLKNMHDWMISKKRYYGLALPIWMCGDCHAYKVVGDEQELKELAVEGWETFQGHTPHRPYIDAVKLKCDACGGKMTRVDEVGNPWLDAGIVPFSTLQYRTNREYWRKWYPADWISESFPGQFRNWFYSLLAMATVIDNSPPFLENFGYATLFAEDGRPMHKSSGNMIEFNEAADKMGVDVMRWLYANHRPEANLLFGYQRADEVRRRFLIPLWNVYNFFVSYALLDAWQPSQDNFDPKFPEGATPMSENVLDQWILARLNQIIANVTDALQATDSLAATDAVEAFLDDLSNWYVRRSRRRFWRGQLDADKNSAYATLYHVLVKLGRLIAPITPFVTEVMYQNLVRNAHLNAFESVHMTYYPQADASTQNKALLAQMKLARNIASLGLSARGNSNLKVRQPLARALAFVGLHQTTLSDELVEIVKDELNVKELALTQQEGDIVKFKILPDNKALGPKFGKKFPALRAALNAQNASDIARRVGAGENVSLEVEGETFAIAPNELLVQTQAAEGLSVASGEGITVAIDTTLTPELVQEGLAREFVRAVQTLRKDAGFDIQDRIVTRYQTDSAKLQAMLNAFGEYIRRETLTTDLSAGASDAAFVVNDIQIEDAPLTIAVKRV